MLIRMMSKFIFIIFMLLFCFDELQANKSSTTTPKKTSTTNLQNPFSFIVDMKTCSKDGHNLPLKRALNDLNTLINLGLFNLYNNPNSEIVEKYFGKIDQGAELIIPIGILTRLQKGTKKNVIVHCGTWYGESDDDEDKDDETTQHIADDWTVCQTSKRIAFEGGFVEQTQSHVKGKKSKSSSTRFNKKKISIVICPQSFSNNYPNSSENEQITNSPTKRKYLEEICQNDFTLNDNFPTIFWPISLLSLLMQVPQLSSPQMKLVKHDFANVLDLAKRNPDLAKHNIYSYLYFLLDIFARKNYNPKGCSGQPSERVNEEVWN